MKFSLSWLIPFVFASGLVQSAQREIPPLSGPIIDEAGVLDISRKNALSNELRQYPPQLQLQIWIVPDLQGEPIESLSIRATDQWKLGTAQQDRGALILVAVNDRQMRIEVGQGLEGEIPDVLAGRIVQEQLMPSFRAGDFFGGLLSASRRIFELSGGNPAALSGVAKVPRGSGGDRGIMFGFFALLFILSLLGGGRRRRGFMGGLLGGALGGWGGRGLGGGGWSGGGGSWGGGGGGFSGGGSSGRW